MLKVKQVRRDQLIAALQSAAYDVVSELNSQEFRIAIANTMPQLYLTISPGRSSDGRTSTKKLTEVREVPAQADPPQVDDLHLASLKQAI